MSVLTYDNISLPYGHTSSFRQEVVYDDQSGTDWMCTKFDIQVNAVININYLQAISATFTSLTVANNAAVIMKAIRQRLLQPRRQLSFSVNGYELIPAQTAGVGKADALNGPKPQSCDITELNSVTFMISYHIIAHYWENNRIDPLTLVVTNRVGSNVLTNRWSETVTIDNCMYSTRTRSGKFMIRSDNKDGYIADMMRSQMAVVAVPEGFIRERSEYTQTPDGLGLQYTVTDKEVFKLPPPPAFEADGEYREEMINGATRKATYRVRLRGSKSKLVSPQDRLVNVAIGMVAIKLRLGLASLAEHAALTVGSYDNWVEFTCTARMNNSKDVKYGLSTNGASGGATAPNTKDSGFAGFMTKVGFSKYACLTPFSEDGTLPPPYQDRGSAGMLLQAAKYYDPSLQENRLGPGDMWSNTNPLTSQINSQMNAGVKVGQAGIQAEG